jgi:CHASE2 domain-containing sensor protein
MFGRLLAAVFGALLLVLLVAGVARAAYELLTPLVPILVTLLALGAVYWFIFRGIRRR